MGRPRARRLTPEEDHEAAEKLIGETLGVEIHGKAIRLNFTYQGKRYRETLSVPVTLANARLAINKRVAIIHDISIGAFDYAEHFPNSVKAKLRPADRNVKLQELYERYIPIKSANITTETESRYRSALNACGEAVGWNVPVNTLRPEDVDQLRSDLIATRRPSTVNFYLATWNGMMEWAKRNEYTDAKLTASFFKSAADEPDPLSFEEYEKVIKQGCLHEQDVALVTLAVYTGLRPGELCGLAREDVEGNKLRIRRAVTEKRALKITKTGKERVIWLVPPALDAVRVLLRLTQDLKPEQEVIEISRHQSRTETITPLVAPIQAKNRKAAGRRMKPPSWSTKWTKLLSRAGVRYRVAYQTRHTYACWSLTAHGNIAFIANQMGHVDYSMLVKIYGRWMDTESENEAEFIWKGLQNSGAYAPLMPQGNEEE